VKGTFGALAIIVTMFAMASFGSSESTAHAAGASAPLAYQQLCTQQSDRVTVIFLWTPSGQGPQWLDLSLANNGFAPGTLVNAGPLDRGQFSFSWADLIPGATHFLRVNTLTPQGWQPSPTYTFTTGVCHPPASLPILFEQHCSTTKPGSVSVTLHWTPGDPGQQWVDLSLFNNNFASGTFVGSGPLPSSQSALAWDGLVERTTHYVRVNTLTSIGWRPGPASAFTTIGCTSPGRTITLTFDDGGVAAGPILDVLARYGVKAIFFPTGLWANAHPDLIKRMMDEGHLVGDHTYSHTNLTLLSADQIRAEIAGGAVGNTNLLRPPYDAFNTLVTSIVKDMGFRLYLWNVDPRDWAMTYPGGDGDIANAVTSHAFPGAVVILHMEVRNTALALPIIIQRLQAAGYTIGW
jgi:peptidoglycan/xylan/chitin deacetylase (PgdA/CDA1 family)